MGRTPISVATWLMRERPPRRRTACPATIKIPATLVYLHYVKLYASTLDQASGGWKADEGERQGRRGGAAEGERKRKPGGDHRPIRRSVETCPPDGTARLLPDDMERYGRLCLRPHHPGTPAYRGRVHFYARLRSARSPRRVHRSCSAGGTGDDGLIQRFGLLVWPDAPGEWRNVAGRVEPLAHQ